MPYIFSERTQIDRFEDIVFDFAHEGNTAPIRVQASRKFVEHVWKIDWFDDAAVKKRFNAEKRTHAVAMKRAEVLTPGLRIYFIG